MKRNVTMICDLQYGSTGKGLIAGYLAEHDAPDVVVTSWGPNSGHTYIDSVGRKFIHTMLANSIVSPRLKYVLIGPGSMINLDALEEEMRAAVVAGIPMHQLIKVLIHPQAAIVTQQHRDIENATMTGIGSTKKGSGEALINKIRRDVNGKAVAWMCDDPRMVNYLISPGDYDDIIDQADLVHVEGAQGYSLGINSGFYPYVTSRECTPAQMMADCLIPIKKLDRVVGSCRTFPIRVANRYDESGSMIGYSGPCYPDQRETSWDELGFDTEYTTVTKLPRRVFTFSDIQIANAIRMTGTDHIFLNFLNYLEEGQESLEFMARVAFIASEFGATLQWVGLGPTMQDVHTIKQYLAMQGPTNV